MFFHFVAMHQIKHCDGQSDHQVLGFVVKWASPNGDSQNPSREPTYFLVI